MQPLASTYQGKQYQYLVSCSPGGALRSVSKSMHHHDPAFDCRTATVLRVVCVLCSRGVVVYPLAKIPRYRKSCCCNTVVVRSYETCAARAVLASSTTRRFEWVCCLRRTACCVVVCVDVFVPCGRLSWQRECCNTAAVTTVE